MGKGVLDLSTSIGQVLALCICSFGISVDAWQYGIMIDAGSGGTRTHFFRYAPRVADPMQPLYGAITVPEELFSVSTRPGISDFAQNVSGLRPYLNDLLDRTKAKIPHLQQEWYLIPIYLKATAGARDLWQDERDMIFAEIRALLFQSPFRFDNNYWARTISGEEEGVSAWLTLNAIQGTYGGTAQTWGALEMGGASTQIAFIPHDVSIIQNYYPLHISYKHLHLYAHSYLEYGYRDANQRLVRKLMQQDSAWGTKKNPIINPCFPAGSEFPMELTPPFASPGQVVWVRGALDVAECKGLAHSLQERERGCTVPAKDRSFANDTTKGACGIGSVYQPMVTHRKFVALGQYAKAAEMLGLPMETLVPLSQFENGIDAVCQKQYKPSDFPDESTPTPNPMKKAAGDCWKVIWMYSTLHKGLNFPLDIPQIMFASTLNKHSVSWALGAMMYEVNYYPWKAGTIGDNFGPDNLAAVSGGTSGESPSNGSPMSYALLLNMLCTCFGAVIGAMGVQAMNARKRPSSAWWSFRKPEICGSLLVS